MGDPALDLSDIIELYNADARQMIDAMRGAASRWEEVRQGGPARQTLRKLSHQLRGSGRTYGYRNVTRYSKAIESIMQRLEKTKMPADDRARKAVLKKIDLLAAVFSA